MADLIKPQTLGGFRDLLPAQALARERLLEVARRVYRSYGFSPIDTPSIEYAEVLLGKGGAESDRQIFRFQDNGERDVALRFDLTIPFARFAAQHYHELGTPFKRYHMGSVWRGERPQRGRYREFMQCDFDTIGTESNASDIETLLVIHDLFVALGFEGDFVISVNNRLLLNGLLERLGLRDRSTSVLRAIDKLAKIGPEGVTKELEAEAQLTGTQAAQVLEFATASGTSQEILDHLAPLMAGSESGQLGIERLRELLAAIARAGVKDTAVRLDLAIARGLDYYTGTIYETFLTADPKIGSVCSGGRCDNLAGLYTKEKLPGIGASLGVDRLLAAMESLERVSAAASPTQVLIAQFDKPRLGDYLALASRLRAAGYATEVFPDSAKLGKQLQYADRKGIPVAVIAGEREFEAGVWQVKHLARQEQTTVPDADLLPRLAELLPGPGYAT